MVPPARHLLRAKDLADARYFEPLTVADLARAAGLSPAHFSREFRRTFGEAPAPVPADPPPRAGRGAAAQHRPHRDRDLLRGRADAASARSPRASGACTALTPLAYRAAFPPAQRHIRVPDCVARAYGRPQNRTFREAATGRPSVASPATDTRRTPMIKIANAQFWVHDQDEALAFYTRTLGWEVRSDVTMDEWNFRWLVVGPVGQDDVGLVLMPVPGPPMLDAEQQRPARRAGRQGRRRHAVPRDRRLPGRLRRAVGAGRRVQRPADAAALRHRHVVPRPVGQQHPPHPGARVRPMTTRKGLP